MMHLKRVPRHIPMGLWVLALLLLLPTLCQAGGFSLYEYGAKAEAMGGANIALADDASAVAYNPAGITQLLGTHVMFGATAIAPTADVRTGSDAKTTTQTNIYVPPHAYLVEQINDKMWFGLGVFTRFGVGTQYSYGWAGRGFIYKAELSTYSVAPNLAIKLTDALSFAFGPEIMYSSADLRSRPSTNGDARITVDGVGFGGQLGLHYKFDEQWSAGFTYHTSQTHRDTGNVKYIESAALQNGDIAMTLTLPASYNFGLAYKPNDKWKLEADAIFTQWQDYDKLIYAYSKKPGAPPLLPGDTVKWKNWRNVWRIQLGSEYMAKDWLALRGGFVWDQDPIRKGYEDYMLPSSDRKIYSTGFGIISGKYTYDFSLMYLRNNHRSIDKNSEIVGATEFSNSQAYMAGFSVGYAF